MDKKISKQIRDESRKVITEQMLKEYATYYTNKYNNVKGKDWRNYWYSMSKWTRELLIPAIHFSENPSFMENDHYEEAFEDVRSEMYRVNADLHYQMQRNIFHDLGDL